MIIGFDHTRSVLTVLKQVTYASAPTIRSQLLQGTDHKTRNPSDDFNSSIDYDSETVAPST